MVSMIWLIFPHLFVCYCYQVILPTFPLMLGARDEAAEFDEMDSATPAEMFNDDPRLEIIHKLTKVYFFHLCPGLNTSIV